MSRFLFLIAGAILALSARPTVAAPAQTAMRTVAYGDLDLSTVVGRRQLQHRVGIAVRDVCTQVWAGDVDEVAEARHCRARLHAELRADQRFGPVFAASQRMR